MLQLKGKQHIMKRILFYANFKRIEFYMAGKGQKLLYFNN